MLCVFIIVYVHTFSCVTCYTIRLLVNVCIVSMYIKRSLVSYMYVCVGACIYELFNFTCSVIYSI